MSLFIVIIKNRYIRNYDYVLLLYCKSKIVSMRYPIIVLRTVIFDFLILICIPKLITNSSLPCIINTSSLKGDLLTVPNVPKSVVRYVQFEV